MKVHYLQHVHYEGLGYIQTWLKEQQHTLSGTHFFEKNYQLPPVTSIDALIVLGGPMGVYDEDQHTWLQQEKDFISACIQSGKKVLGICLGAQLIASCLGTKVTKAIHKEIGWFPVFPTEECKSKQWFYELFKNSPTVFHWHGDQFQIPISGLNLLNSKANTNQALYYNDHIIGLQFHLEIDDKCIEEFLKNGIDELQIQTYIQSINKIENTKAYFASCNFIMSEILNHWLSAK